MKRVICAAALVTGSCTASPGTPDDDAVTSDTDPDTDGAVADGSGTDRAIRRMPDAVYRRAMRDLFGVELPDAVVLPGDADTRGFRNQGDVLEVSPALIAAWEVGAELVVAEVLRRPGAGVSTELATVEDSPRWGDPWTWHGTVQVVEPGVHHLSLEVHLQNYSPFLAPGEVLSSTASLWVGGQLTEQPITISLADPVVEVTAEVMLSVGQQPVHLMQSSLEAWRFTSSAPLAVGPLAPLPNPAREQFVTCDLDGASDACTAELVARTARRAWRRPLRAGELDGLLEVAADARAAGGSADEALGAALRAVVLSPNFLFYVEPDDGDAPRPLEPWELGGRLAEKLLGSIPDELLLARVEDGTITDPAVLTAEAERLLADPRAHEAITSDLLIDWFGLDGLASIYPASAVYPTFDDALRTAMRDEVEALLLSFVASDRPLDELLTSTRASVSAPLAALYGTQAGAAVDVGAAGRVGLLGTSAVLTLTSNPNRASPTRRGKFVLERLLCDPPGDVPPGVPPLPDDDASPDAVAEHTANPACAQCHAGMDPLGFALGAFDGIGGRRGGAAVGTLPDGTELDGIVGLTEYLAEGPTVRRCLADQVVTWGLSRDGRDEPAATASVVDALDTEGTLHAALLALVATDAFRQHRREP